MKKLTLLGGLGLAVLGMLPSASADGVHNPYGTTSHLTRTGYEARTGLCAKFGGAGAKWMRMDFDWRALEREPGVWTFGRYDDILATAESNGVQVVGILTQPPARCQPVWEHLTEWKAFVRTLATRYRGRLPVYEVWNEEDSESFWGYAPDATNYTALLCATYETLKAVDPSIRVALGSLTHAGLGFGEKLYQAGAARGFDLMNVHPYPVYGRAQKPWPEGYLDTWLAELRELMTRHGDADKEIWITEIGWPAPHRIAFGAPGVLRAGLRAIAPAKENWRALVVDPSFEKTIGGDALLTLLQSELSEDSEVSGCGFADFAEALVERKPELVLITPRTQLYPIRNDKALVGFVKAGGVLADFGGLPFYEGRAGEKGAGSPAQLRRVLHLGTHNWWEKDLPAVPKEIRVRPTEAAADVKCPPEGFLCQRFMSDRYLRAGDVFTPLLTATWTNGVTCVGAAAIKHAKGGGGLIVCGMFEGESNVFSEHEQACYLPRVHLVAFDSGVSTVMWYELRSHDYDRHDNGWGLLHLDLSEKLSWTAYKVLLEQRPAGSVALPVPTRNDGVWHVGWRRPDGRLAGALWREEGKKVMSIDLGDGEFSFTSFLGLKVRPSRRHGRWVLTISEEVVYYCAE